MLAASLPARPRKPQPGDRYAGKYLLGRRFAVGGMGEIWVAKNEMTGADVALKVLRGDLERREETEARFRHEARLGAMLTHRNIVRVFDLLAEPDGTLILVMELLRGVSLRRAISQRATPFSAEEAIAILLPILSALQHAHDNSVVHRDLKPANILLAVDPDNHLTPKLLDFGIARVPSSSIKTLFGRVLGTPRYMSPEQIRADPKIDGRSDVFSAGSLLVEMLTGIAPFAASAPSASLAAVIEQDVDPDPRIDPRLWLVIRRALAKRPYERYSSAAEFALALREAIGKSESDLAAVLQKAAKAAGTPSYSELSAGFVRGDSDEGNDEDSDDERYAGQSERAANEVAPDQASRGTDPGIGDVADVPAASVERIVTPLSSRSAQQVVAAAAALAATQTPAGPFHTPVATPARDITESVPALGESDSIVRAPASRIKPKWVLGFVGAIALFGLLSLAVGTVRSTSSPAARPNDDESVTGRGDRTLATSAAAAMSAPVAAATTSAPPTVAVAVTAKPSAIAPVVRAPITTASANVDAAPSAKTKDPIAPTKRKPVARTPDF